MKINVLLFICLGFLFACQEDEPKPTNAEKQAVLLAGKKGESKKWLVSGYRVDGQEVEAFGCLEDNEYTFFNNALQTFEGDEGDDRCLDGQTEQPLPQEIESGNWAFTIDGSIVIISSASTQSPVAIFSAFTELGNPFPMEIVSLTKTELVIETDYTVDVFSETVRVTFVAAN